jgi:hypothetical protein
LLTAHIAHKIDYINVLIANNGIDGPRTSSLTASSNLEEYQAILFAVNLNVHNATFALNITAVYFSMAAFPGLLDTGNRRGNV